MTTPLNLAEALELAFAHLGAGRVDEARRLARRIEKQLPTLPGLDYLQGRIALAQGADAKAARHLARALAANPDEPALLLTMARIQGKQGRDSEAEDFYRRHLAALPESEPARRELAGLLVKRANAHHEARQFAEAVALLTEVATLEPESGPAAWMLAEARNALGDRAGAVALYRRSLALDPADRYGARMMLARLGADPAPDRPPEAFIRELFDNYADEFDAQLIERLNYRAPALLVEAIRRTLGAGPFDAFDAGCGTGLMGAALRPMARRLAGADLSPRMVERARGRGVYDVLATGDLVALLAAAPSAYDLVTAADVLVYLGDLTPVIAAVATALRPGGGFAFTVEHGAGDGWTYLESGRYAHAAAYLRRLGAAHGLPVALLDEASTRDDHGQPVPGLICVMRKAG